MIKRKNDLTANEMFFFDHAGFSYTPVPEGTANWAKRTERTKWEGKVSGAKELARAEQYAREHDWVFTWEEETENPVDVYGEPDPVNGPFFDPTNDWSCCVLRDNNEEVLESLGMIEESKDNRERDNYRRVVEAELASEALDRIETEERNAEECRRLLTC